MALDAVRQSAVEVEYWPTLDPTGIGENREQRIAAYRQTRDQIVEHIRTHFAAPVG